MFNLHPGAANGGAAAKAMAEYLTEVQISPDTMRAAEYYGQTKGAEDAIAAGVGCVPMPRADMAVEVADALGIQGRGPVSVEALSNLLAGKRADGAPLAGDQHDVAAYKGDAENGSAERHKLAYLDLGTAAPKSLSVAFALAETDAERNSLLQAHRESTAETLTYVESIVGWARTGKGGEGPLERAKIGWITVDHYTARPTETTIRTDPKTGEVYTEEKSLNVTGDPHIHSHSITPNVMVTESGRVVALNTLLFHGHKLHFGAVYDAILKRKLQAIGIEAELDSRTNKLHLSAVPHEVCAEYSKRTQDGQGAAKERAATEGRDWDEMTKTQQIGYEKYGTRKTRRDKETNTPDIQAWREQAARINYQHRSVIAYGPPPPPRTYAERMNLASQMALPHLADMLSKRAVIGQGDIRLAAARGFMTVGLESAIGDMGAMMKHWANGSVMQDGQRTKLIWLEAERGRVRLTTELHRDQETELMDLAHRAVADKRQSLSSEEISVSIAKGDYRYDRMGGNAQRDAVETLGTDGGLAVMIGAAGTGKTSAVLSPLVAAYQARGVEVWGTAQAWRQAKDLKDSGVQTNRRRALQPFLDGAQAGHIKLTTNSVVVLDELGQIGTRQLLDLMRLREKYGFKLIAVGDNKQAQSIDAGPVIDLLRKAIGEERIPEILTTVRQKTEEERRIATLFRDGKAGEAIAAKRENCTAELAPGGYREAVERVATLYAERRQATKNQADYSITISAPTNADAREISRAVREKRREMGEVGVDAVTVAATDGRGNGFNLTLAPGDNIRLFKRTSAMFKEASNQGRSSSIGDNGTILRVESILPHEGLMLRGESGKTGFVSWRNLQERGGSDRILLGYGDCLTIDSSQGITSDEHIDAMPSGSSSVPGFKSYVANSRHRVRSYMVGSMGAEMREVKTHRPSGLPVMTPDQAADAAWANLTKNLEKMPVKESALAFLEKAVVRRRDTVKVFQGALRRHETRVAEGKSATTVKQTAALKQVRAALPQIDAGLREVARQQIAVRETLNAMHDYWSNREGRRIDVAARLVSEGDMFFGDAVDRIVSAQLADEHRGAPINPIHRIPKVLPGAESIEEISERIESRLMAALDAYEARQIDAAPVVQAPRQKVGQSV